MSSGILTLSGYGVRLAVERGHLIAEDGIADDRASQRFARVGHDLQRVFILGQSGSITLDALQWLADVGVPFVHFGGQHRIIAASPANVLNDVRVRRGQALAAAHPIGIDVTRRLLTAKLDGQRRVLDRLPQRPKAIEEVEAARDTIEQATDLEVMRYLEAKAAIAYWSAWEAMSVQFATKDARKVPAHWRRVGGRRSLLQRRGPMRATSPVNAIRNYLYAILEAETRLACWGTGLDPELGILHFDQRGRSSCACDLMEPVRADVDNFVFEFVRTHTFSRNDFFEGVDGHCRVMPQLAKPLANSALRWMKAVAPYAEEVADVFLRLGRELTVRREGAAITQPSVGQLPSRTPLTNRKAHKLVRVERATLIGTKEHRLMYRCRECGVDVGSARKDYCPSCRDKRFADAASAGHKSLAIRRSEGRDKRSSETARKRHSESATELWRRMREWESANGGRPTKDEFRQRFSARVGSVPARQLREATGLTNEACNMIRRGKLVPHPMHWSAIARVIAASSSA